jgi:hypothetical protein
VQKTFDTANTWRVDWVCSVFAGLLREVVGFLLCDHSIHGECWRCYSEATPELPDVPLMGALVFTEDRMYQSEFGIDSFHFRIVLYCA